MIDNTIKIHRYKIVIPRIKATHNAKWNYTRGKTSFVQSATLTMKFHAWQNVVRPISNASDEISRTTKRRSSNQQREWWNFTHNKTSLVVKGYDGGQMKASDWSKNYANHLVTSLNDRSHQKWSNQNGESSFMECDWLTVMRYDWQVWTDQWERRIDVLGRTLAEAVHKKEGGFLFSSQKRRKAYTPKKKHIFQNKKKMEERTYEDILMEVLLELLFDRMTKEEMDLLRDQLVEFSGITVHYVMGLKNRVRSSIIPRYRIWWRPVGARSSCGRWHWTRRRRRERELPWRSLMITWTKATWRKCPNPLRNDDFEKLGETHTKRTL